MESDRAPRGMDEDRRCLMRAVEYIVIGAIVAILAALAMLQCGCVHEGHVIGPKNVMDEYVDSRIKSEIGRHIAAMHPPLETRRMVLWNENMQEHWSVLYMGTVALFSAWVKQQKG